MHVLRESYQFKCLTDNSIYLMLNSWQDTTKSLCCIFKGMAILWSKTVLLQLMLYDGIEF